MPDLHWINLLWPMGAASSLTLGMVHFFIWFKQKRHLANLLFAFTAVAVASLSMLELAMMHARTTGEYESLMKWAHVPIAIMILGMVGFIHVHFRAGNTYLAIATCLTRLACLVPNFLSGANLNVIAVGALQRIPVGGGSAIVVPQDPIVNPWAALGALNIALFTVYLISFLLDILRRGRTGARGSALRVGGAILIFVTSSAGWTWAVEHGVVEGPLLVTPTFLLVLLVMGYELGRDMLRATHLARTLDATEHSLQDSERRIERVVHATNIGLWTWEIADGQCWFSDRALLILSLQREQVVDAAAMRALVHPEDRSQVDEALARSASAGGDFRCECRVHGTGGSVRWIDARGQVEFDASGAPLRLQGMLLDITARKQTEDRLRKVVEQVPVAMLMVDQTGTITLANRQAEALLGFSSDEFAGMPVADIMPERQHGAAWRDRLRSSRSLLPPSKASGREGFALRRDRREVPVEMAVSSIALESGEFQLLSMIDLTQRIEMERESAVQRDELAHLSRVSVMSELSGSLAHELNQPLTAILSNAQASIRFLAHTPPNLEEVRGGLANVVDSAKRAGEGIRRMRALLRKERADHRLLDLNEVVLDVMQLARIDLLYRNVELILELEEDLPPVTGDRVQLQQVLLNLAMNGSDAMTDAAHPRRMTVSTRVAASGVVEVAVADVGTGIPEDRIAHIFSPFMTTKPEGLGFGLAVCATILNAHGGSLHAVNNTGPGATISFRVPARVPLADHG